MLVTWNRTLANVGSVITALVAVGCGIDRGAAASSREVAPAEWAAAGPAPAPVCDLEPIPLRNPAAGRVVAIGDLHGDLAATRAALRLAGAIDPADRWIGGDLVVVQTGDVLDRGDDEPEILDLLSRLAGEASAAGGKLIRLNGNHELMNAAGDFRYVTSGGFADFVHVLADGSALAELPEDQRGRAAAFFPGGPWARRLADANIATIVGDTAYVHGGILPAYASRLEEMSLASRCWLIGRSGMPGVVNDTSSPIWSRDYASPPERCDLLERALDALGVDRMVVGHTTNISGITAACDGRVWRIDVGLAVHYGGPRQVLELRGDDVRVLAE